MRRLKKEEHRRSEEERRRRRLEEAAEAPLANANVDTEIQEAAATTMIPKRQYQHRAEIRGRTGNLDAPSPHDTFFPPNKRSSFPQNVGFTLLKSSPSSSVSMSQSPAKAAVRTLTARKTTLFDSDDSSEEEDILESARRLERRKMERNKAARDEAVPVVEKTVSINAPQPVIHVRKKRFPVLDDSDSDGKDLTIAAQKLEQMRGQRQVAIGLSSSSADASRAPIAINDDTVVAISKTPRNPLALMREQNAADFNNLQPLAQTMSKEAVMQLWSDSEDETSSLQLSSKKKRTKNDDDRDVAETEHIAIMNNNKKRQRRLDMQQSKPDRHAIAPTILDTEDEENLRKQNKPEFDHPMFGPYNFPTPLVLGAGLSGDEGFQVPASITRYLLKHQLEGIEFLYKKAIVSGRGAILGDGKRLFVYIASLYEFVEGDRCLTKYSTFCPRYGARKGMCTIL